MLAPSICENLGALYEDGIAVSAAGWGAPAQPASARLHPRPEIAAKARLGLGNFIPRPPRGFALTPSVAALSRILHRKTRATPENRRARRFLSQRRAQNWSRSPAPPPLRSRRSSRSHPRPR